MASGNITNKGDKVMSFDSQSAPRPHQRKILQACQQHAEQYVEGLFKQVLDKLDDLLFERGNMAGEGAEAFLDAARELRMKRNDMSHALLDGLANTYQSRLRRPDSITAGAKNEDSQSGGLSLVDEQDLEESLAIDGLVAKAGDRFRNELYALAQRFNQLLDGAQYSEDRQPLAPDTISGSFRDIFQELEWKVEIKLITYKVFEKAVLQSLGEFYQEINTLLSDAGILPELKLGVGIRSTGGGAQGHSSSASGSEMPAQDASQIFPDDSIQAGMPGETQGAAASADVFQTLQQLMNVRKYGAASAEGEAGGMSGGGAGGMAVPGTMMGPSLPADDLLRGLSLLQHTPLPIDPGAAINVAVIKDALLEQMKQIGDGRGIDPSHDNTIDVIGMIFEFILDEPSIPDVVKNLLNRLQIPILKIAIVDKAFFTNKTHPARRLLNVLGHASIGWNDNSEESRQRRFEKMEYVVSRVLDEFEQDPGIFATLLDEFSGFLTTEGDELDAEQVTPLDEEQVQEESFDKLAFETVEGYLEGAEVPEVLREFLRSTWRNVLQHILDGEGHEGDGWRRHVQTIEDLMWSVEPKTGPDERRKMVMLLPRLLDALREGMALVDCSQEEMDGVIDALEPIHMACLRGEKPPVEQAESEQPDHAADESEVSSSDVSDMIRSIQAGMSQGGDAMSDDGLDLENGVTETEPAFASHQEDELAEEEQIDDEYTTTAAEMKLGTWLEFAIEDKKRRGKLAWKSVVMGEYVFVDRRYKVVAERTLATLAADLRHGRASLVEDVAMFDRALDKVLNGLMSSGGASH